jgi:hypothetical protein
LDPANLFCTPRTYWALRAEYFAGFVASIVVAVMHISHIDWVAAVLLFAYPDTLGYLPGAIVYHRSRDKRISLWYARSYNAMHSALTAGLVGGLYAIIHGPNWALLAVPMHLCGDRALFGNIMKMMSVRFEPHEPHPVYARVKKDLERPWWEFEQTTDVPAAAATAQPARTSEPAVAP